MIKYLGSKRLMLPAILDAIDSLALGACPTVLDLFSGTSRVGHALKRRGSRVIACDHNSYAHTLAACYVQSDDEHIDAAHRLIDEFNALAPTGGYFTETFCVCSRFFHPKNGARVDAIRDEIERKGLEPELKAIVLTSLMEAADRVDSTTGVQMAYLKAWAPRAQNDLLLRVPDLLARPLGGMCEAHRMDAFDAARSVEADVAYIDPPYNQHSYLGNYHVWESLVRWDKPEVYGVACKRVDVRQRQSVFNSRPAFAGALTRLFNSLRCKALVVSFSDEGFITRDNLQQLLQSLDGATAVVRTLNVDYKRYVGAKIGIYNPQGQKVGRVGHLRNTETLFIVTRPACRVSLPNDTPSSACDFAFRPAPIG